MRIQSSRPLTLTVLGAAITGAVLLGMAPPASAVGSVQSAAVSSLATATYSPSAADKRIASALGSRVTTARFGTSFTGAVIDSGSNATVWSRNGGTALKPASTDEARHRVERLVPVRPGQAFHDEGSRGVGEQPRHPPGLRRSEPEQRGP